MTRPAAPESETPETDSEYESRGHEIHSEDEAGNEVIDQAVDADFARSLERRLALAQTEIKGHMRVEDELKAEVAKLRIMVDECHGWLEDTRRKNVEAQARIAELEKDAARYRWLREHHRSDVKHRLVWYLPRSESLDAEGLDAAIDSALKSRA